MTSTTFVKVDTRNAEELLLRVNTALNPTALSEFLIGDVGPWLQERGRQRFAQEGDDVSGKWAPLQDSTQRIREAGQQAGFWTVGPEHPINKRTGELEDYITHGVGTTIPWSSGSSLVFPDPSPMPKDLRAKLKTAQRGSPNPRTVARPVLGLNEQDLQVVLTRLLNHISAAAKGTVTFP